MSRTKAILTVVVAVVALSTAACASSPKTGTLAGANSSSSRAAAPVGGDATAACKALAAWESGSATDSLFRDPARANIAALGAGTQFGTDFNTWMNDLDQGSGMDQISADSAKVSADCAAAGVPGLLGGTDNSSVAPAGEQTDPYGEQCASLDSQGYCGNDDPLPSSPASTMTKQTDTIVFKVWGTGEPSVQYGTDSSTNNPSGGAGPLGDGNYLPWQASMPYDPTALYYAVTAQLEGSGSIHDSVTEVVITWCSGSKPKTESFQLADGSASGGYGIARAEYAGGDTGNATQAESDAGC